MAVIPIWVAEYIGIQFREKGREAEGGVDCWGLVLLLFWDGFHIKLPSLIEGYRNTVDARSIMQLIKEEAEDWEMIDSGKERFGDVVVMLVKGRPMHVGMVVEKGKMIHIEHGIDSCLERYDGVVWKNRVVGFYRHARLR